jgi:hypothetical protein
LQNKLSLVDAFVLPVLLAHHTQEGRVCHEGCVYLFKNYTDGIVAVASIFFFHKEKEPVIVGYGFW